MATKSISNAGEATDSKIQLILAGEKLFAERGFEGASLREIASAAAHGNNNAVRYHFGSKQGLIQAIFRYRVAQMEPVRAHLLAKLEAEGLLTDARSLFEVIVLPYFNLRSAGGSFSYPGFMLQYLLYHRPRGMPHAGDEQGETLPALSRVQLLLRKRLDFLDYETADRRILHAMLTFVSAVVSAENIVPAPSAEQYRALIDDTIAHIVAGMLVPQQAKREKVAGDPWIANDVLP